MSARPPAKIQARDGVNYPDKIGSLSERGSAKTRGLRGSFAGAAGQNRRLGKCVSAFFLVFSQGFFRVFFCFFRGFGGPHPIY